jgi:hypothetical protein
MSSQELQEDTPMQVNITTPVNGTASEGCCSWTRFGNISEAKGFAWVRVC